MPDYNLLSKTTENANLKSIHLRKEFAASINYKGFYFYYYLLFFLLLCLCKQNITVYFQCSTLALVGKNAKMNFDIFGKHP